ncbi:MAG: flagellar assembly protein FliW [Chloroflexi bacterium]|nr:flagellar assembly protein FliW [Chloroflexota bacterium]
MQTTPVDMAATMEKTAVQASAANATQVTSQAPTTMIRTTRFGELETVQVSADDLLTFPEGMPGFERHHRFALLTDERLHPFRWLQSLQDPLVGFLVIEPGLLAADYEFDVPDPDVELLRLEDPNEARVFSVLVVPEEITAMTANLQAPIVINPACGLAKQVILTDERFPLRFPVFGDAEARSPGRRRTC